MARTGFIPSRDGFHFANAFVNTIVQVGPWSLTTGGRCGGMAYAALDYYWNGIVIPTHISSASPFSSQPVSTGGSPVAIDDFASTGGVPPDGSLLADYIWQRLIDSIGAYATKWLDVVERPDKDTHLAGKGLIGLTKEDEWSKLKDHIDGGCPIPIGLVADVRGFEGLGQSHVVVAIGYEETDNTRKVFIYDNNHPDEDNLFLESTADDTNPHWNENSDSHEIWRGFFVEDSYSPHTPSYTDLQLSAGISVSSATPLTTDTFTAGFTVENIGAHPAHARTLFLAFFGADLSDRSALLGSDGVSPANVDPGATTTLSRSTPLSSLPEGTYTIRAQFETLQGHWYSIHAPAGSSAEVTIDVHYPPAVVIDVLGAAQVLTREGGNAVGSYGVRVQARAFHFEPVSVAWKADEGTPAEQSAFGNPVSVNLRVGKRSGPLVYDHTIKVTATDAAGKTASSTYALQLPTPDGLLEARYDDPASQVAAERVEESTGATRTAKAYSNVLVEAVTGAFFGALTYSWAPPSPTLVRTLAGGSEAIFAMQVSGDPQKVESYAGVNVSAHIADEIGQLIDLAGFIGSTVETLALKARAEWIKSLKFIPALESIRIVRDSARLRDLVDKLGGGRIRAKARADRSMKIGSVVDAKGKPMMVRVAATPRVKLTRLAAQRRPAHDARGA